MRYGFYLHTLLFLKKYYTYLWFKSDYYERTLQEYGDNFMTISILLMKQIAQLFLMIFMGYLIVKTGIVEDTDSKVLSKIILYLVIPCVIINAFQVDYTSDTVRGLLLAFIASILTQIVLLIVVSVLGKLFHLNEVEIASIYYSNSGNLIVPIVTFILGKEWVLYGCVFMSVQLILYGLTVRKLSAKRLLMTGKRLSSI